MIAPPLRHLHPLFPVCAPVIGRPHAVGVLMCKGALYGVGMPLAAFVKERAGHCPEAVGAHFIRPEVHAPEGRHNGVFGKRPARLARGREHIVPVAGEHAGLCQNVHRLP